MTCTVTGVLKNLAGEILPNAVLLISGATTVAATEGAVVAFKQLRYISDDLGAVEFEAFPGDYNAKILSRYWASADFTVSVPDALAADLADLIVQVSGAVDVPLVAQARSWAEVAEDFATATQLASLRTFDTYAALAADTTLTPANTPVGATVSVRGVGHYVAVASGGDVVNAGGVQLAVLAGANGFDVTAFGAVDGAADNTAPIQAAIDRAASVSSVFTTSGGVQVYVPAGLWRVTRIIRRAGVHIVGAGPRNTAFVALPRTAPTGQDPVFGLFEIDEGQVVASDLRGIFISGSAAVNGTTPVNASQWGIYTRAKFVAATPIHGGLWHSAYKDVWVHGFANGEWSRGGYTNQHSLLPNQFLIYENFTVQVADGGEARRFTGQHGQIVTTNGDTGGLPGTSSNLAVNIDWDSAPSQVATNGLFGESTTDVSGVGNATRAPTLLAFSGGNSIQRTRRGVFIRNTRQVSFDGVWFENVGGAFDLGTNGGVTIAATRFANAADGLLLAAPSSGAGYLAKMGVNASLNFGAGNVIAGTFDGFIAPGADLNLVNSLNFADASLTTDGKTNVTTLPTLTLSAAGLVDLKGRKYAFVRAYQTDTAVPLTSISSYLTPGDIVTIRAWQGPISITNTGNIRLGAGVQTITLGDSGYATFARVSGFSGVEWVLVSRDDVFSDAVPTSGYWQRGTKIWKVNPSAAASPGWIVTTTGTAGAGAVFSAMHTLA